MVEVNHDGHRPVCKMEIEEESASHKTKYQEKTYNLCSAACKNAFEANPDSNGLKLLLRASERHAGVHYQQEVEKE